MHPASTPEHERPDKVRLSQIIKKYDHSRKISWIMPPWQMTRQIKHERLNYIGYGTMDNPFLPMLILRT